MVICPKSHSKTQNDSDSARNLRRILNWNYRRLGRDTRRNGLHLIGIVMYLCGFHLRIQKDAQALYYVVDRHILNSSPIRNQKLVCRASPCFRVSVVLFVPLEIGFCWIPCRADQPEPIPIRKMRLLEHWHCRATVELQKRSRKRGDGRHRILLREPSFEWANILALGQTAKPTLYLAAPSMTNPTTSSTYSSVNPLWRMRKRM